MRPRFLTAALVLAKFAVGVLAAVLASQPARSQVEEQLTRILTDQKLWGEDAFAVFASLDRWKTSGVVSIAVFSDRVVSGAPLDAPDPARQMVARMTAAMQGPRPRLRPEFAARYSEALAARAPAVKLTSARFPEDDSFRAEWRRDGGEFLKKGLTVRAVLDAYGQPERTTTEVVHALGDRRPAVLTLHHYAGGAVKVVESDLAPEPGLVDRVVLDVDVAVGQIFETSP